MNRMVEILKGLHPGLFLHRELGDFVADSRIDAWIFGHSHANIDATIGNTRIVCNQLGYVYCRENLDGFDGRKFIEV